MMQTGKDLFSDPIKSEERPSVYLGAENIKYYLHPVAQSEKRQVWLAAHGINVVGRAALSDGGCIRHTMVPLSGALHCLSHRRPYYMPYLAWRIPFLSALNFNANALRWPAHSSSCFDIIFHIPCVCWFIISCWIRKGICLQCSTLNLFVKMEWDWILLNVVVCQRRLAACFRAALQREQGGRVSERRRFGVSVKRLSRLELGAPIKAACFMRLLRHFEVLESPTALSSSSSLVS